VPSTIPTAPTTTLATTTTTASPPSADEVCPATACLVYHIAERATWSDGTTVTSDDFIATIADALDPLRGGPSTGYDQISHVEVIDDKTFRLDFDRPHGAWQSLFDRLQPAAGSTTIEDVASTGAFRFVEWVPGDRIVLERIPGWWSSVDPISGLPAGEVTEIRFVFIEDHQDMLTALERGEVDVITTRPDEETIGRLEDEEDIRFSIAPGPFWEHIDFHHEDSLLAQRWLREAIWLAIDREKILDRTIRLIDPGSSRLDNTLWMTNAAWYEAHMTASHDPAAAEQILVDNSCVLDDDDVYRCGDRRLEFVWATTSDDPARREIFESVSEDLAAVGIDLAGAFRPPSAFVAREFLFGSSEVWQIINFSWRARSDPHVAETTYLCEGELNVNRYCNPELESLMRATATITDPEGRAAAINEVDRLYLDDLVVIPLYQKPTMMAWSAEITGPSPNFTYSTDLWNVAAWSGKSSLVIALPAEPLSLTSHSRGDDSAEIVLSTMLYGAFGMTPAQQFVPVLVESVVVLEGGG